MPIRRLPRLALRTEDSRIVECIVCGQVRMREGTDCRITQADAVELEDGFDGKTRVAVDNAERQHLPFE